MFSALLLTTDIAMLLRHDLFVPMSDIAPIQGCGVRHANASRLAIVKYQAQGCGADVLFLRRCIRAYPAVGVRFSFRAISRAVIPVFQHIPKLSVFRARPRPPGRSRSSHLFALPADLDQTTLAKRLIYQQPALRPGR